MLVEVWNGWWGGWRGLCRCFLGGGGSLGKCWGLGGLERVNVWGVWVGWNWLLIKKG